MPVTDTDFVSTLAVTDVVDSATVLPANGLIKKTGLNQGDLYALISSIITNFNATNAKLDADAGVNDTDYATNGNLSAVGAAGYKLTKNGMHQADLITCLTAMATQFAVVTAQLDSDTGVTDTDYASTLDFTLDTTELQKDGIKGQGDITTYLKTVITNFNALLAKLDADA